MLRLWDNAPPLLPPLIKILLYARLDQNPFGKGGTVSELEPPGGQSRAKKTSSVAEKRPLICSKPKDVFVQNELPLALRGSPAGRPLRSPIRHLHYGTFTLHTRQ